MSDNRWDHEIFRAVMIVAAIVTPILAIMGIAFALFVRCTSIGGMNAPF